MFNQKGQGSIEYLLILGGAILVAVIIIAAVVSLGQSTGGGALSRNTLQGLCSTQGSETACEALAFDKAATTTNCQYGTTAADCCWKAGGTLEPVTPGETKCWPNPTNTYS